MQVTVLADAEQVAQQAAAFLARQARAAVVARGRFLVAVSGGATPSRMLELWSGEDVPWDCVHLFQVDERLVAAADPARNFSRLQVDLLDKVPIPRAQVHPMPVEEADPVGAAALYSAALQESAGSPPVLDLIHLGLGEDGHVASLVPEDPALDETVAEVTVTGLYRGHRRMTLTFPVLNRARCILWLVTGPTKVQALRRLLQGDSSLPGGRVNAAQAWLLTDVAQVGASA